MALQIDNYNKKHNTKYNYLIPCNLYGEYDKFDSIKGHFVGALLYKIYLAKKHKKKINNFIWRWKSSKTIYVCRRSSFDNKKNSRK